LKITRLDKDNKKFRVYIDEEYAFCLFYKELKRFNIEIEGEITEDCLERIHQEVIIKRGIQYIYHLLAKKAYTYYELEQKMQKAGYINVIIETVLDKFLVKGFIDDLSYAKRYIESHHRNKSNTQMIYNLKNKGIKMNTIQIALEELGLDEVEAAKKVILRRLKGNEELTSLEQNKLFKYMLNKGYKMDTIKSVLRSLNKKKGE
jgi:regulatory protein